ncbi:MAG TPA: Hsp20/alpha crystallin family protein [Acidimicrobiia bacterium]|nr:Hsp20/alpha crystallin family protein [Acidimicrobiia bacterium]
MAKTSVVRKDERSSMPSLSDRFDAPIWAALLDWPSFAALRDSEQLLRIEESVDEDTLVIRSEIPGIDPDKDVEIDVRDHMLEIRAERREEKTSEENGARRSEFRYGSFYRAVPLPADVHEDDIQASYKDGILEVRVPQAAKPEPKRHRISIKRK